MPKANKRAAPGILHLGQDATMGQQNFTPRTVKKFANSAGN
jgi:hypothetical protein